MYVPQRGHHGPSSTHASPCSKVQAATIAKRVPGINWLRHGVAAWRGLGIPRERPPGARSRTTRRHEPDGRTWMPGTSPSARPPSPCPSPARGRGDPRARPGHSGSLSLHRERDRVRVETKTPSRRPPPTLSLTGFLCETRWGRCVVLRHPHPVPLPHAGEGTLEARPGHLGSLSLEGGGTGWGWTASRHPCPVPVARPDRFRRGILDRGEAGREGE